MADTTTNTLTPPTLSDMSTWQAFANLAPWAKGGNRVAVDTDGNVWLQTPNETQSFPMTPHEAVQLAQFLCERFDLVVLNEPEEWGNEANRCDCDTVPARVVCGGCNGVLHSTNAMGERAAWESDRTRKAQHVG